MSLSLFCCLYTENSRFLRCMTLPRALSSWRHFLSPSALLLHWLWQADQDKDGSLSLDEVVRLIGILACMEGWR